MDDRIVESLHKPLPAFIFSTGCYYILSKSNYFIENQDNIVEIYQSFLIIIVFWVGYRFIHTYESLFPLSDNKLYAPYIIRLLKVILAFVFFYLLLENWGYDLSKLLAGVGITGIAFAFAARDTFSNIFSGIVIIIEKPFSIGENISNDNIEGTIIDINFRSTTIKTIDQTVVVVPNSQLINSPLINKTRSDKRKIETYIALENDTVSISDTKKILKNCLDEKQIDISTVNVKVDSIYETFTLFKIIAFSSLSPIELAEYKQEYLIELTNYSKERNLKVYYLGFDKWKPEGK
jgi:MscS family membrane protein